MTSGVRILLIVASRESGESVGGASLLPPARTSICGLITAGGKSAAAVSKSGKIGEEVTGTEDVELDFWAMAKGKERGQEMHESQSQPKISYQV
jgi:hypothetical protein